MTVQEPDELADTLDRAYRLILGRPADPDGATGYLVALRAGELDIADVCATLAGSAEFTERLRPTTPTEEAVDGPAPADDPDWVDVAELINTTSVAELAETAENYFRAVEDPDNLLAKPVKDAGEAPDLFVTFGQVLRGLQVLPGMTVLDFGAGTCWTSRLLAQLGCRVIALDVSPTALEFGRQLFDRQPLIGAQPTPEFLVFDGKHIDLPDASVDRVLCYDALHHVPNVDEVITELARVLRPGGIAAFSEPGEAHSAHPQSQYEMRHYGVLENDLSITDIWQTAGNAGFTELRLCLLDINPQWVDLATFQDIVAGRAGTDWFVDATRAAVGSRRMFWLRKVGTEPLDSRAAQGLVGELAIDDLEVDTSGGNPVWTGTCRVRNPGPRSWLPSDAGFGAVSLGVRLHLGDRTTRTLARIPLPGHGFEPGQETSFPVRVEIPTQPERITAVEFDLVSEKVCWFSVNGSPVVTVGL
ncbi:methyltransferase family protein [Tamaricihabitans halophyticus]|uniref:Methyltransferase family protein n=1 Tax=Tamaricihabitans halophyticus TaxID=1262583 RepID=A0A4R2QGX1_9PSEU|nr:class I SAM-dependent methyltransferase [Tamaricihabitans halophyticus]TCP48482.1 methyltransferase family protein [Tamaricihabitans halophyticus]